MTVKEKKLWENKYKGRYTLVLRNAENGCMVETVGICGFITKQEAREKAIEYPKWKYRVRPTTKADFFKSQFHKQMYEDIKHEQ